MDWYLKHQSKFEEYLKNPENYNNKESKISEEYSNPNEKIS